MKLEWMGDYRDILGNYYRSANGYSQMCKIEQFGDKVKFSPYEVQIMESILEHFDEHRNMKWHAGQLGLGQATYTKYVQKLVAKGLVEKYHAKGNKKDIILMLSPLGMKEYEKHTEMMKNAFFRDLFAALDAASPEELAFVRKVFAICGGWHMQNDQEDEKKEPVLLKLEG